MAFQGPERRPNGTWLLAAALVLACAQIPARDALNPFGTGQPTLTLERPSDLVPPDGLRVTSTADRAIGLAWDPVLVGDVAGYAVLRAGRSEAPFVLVGQTKSRFGTVYLDSGDGDEQLGDGATYHFHIHPFDREGRVSRSHAHISATTEPRPDVPRGLRVYSNLPRRVVLAWDPNPRSSTTGYAVVRSPTVAGPWERVGSTEGRLSTVHEDPVPGDLRVMYYRIVARNRFGGESDESEPMRAVTKAAPLAPVGLEVESQQLGRVVLRWAPNVEPDLDAYEVWRATGNGDGWRGEQRIGQTAASETRFEDTDVACGQKLRYRLRTLDHDELHSAWSAPLEVQGATIGLELVSGNGEHPRLRWDPERAAGWPAARIVEMRRLRPDRLLAELSGAAEAPLAGLAPGERHLAVLLSEKLPNATGTGSGPVQRCEIQVQIP
jgi:fibronectin type 3 domain-containing protein